MSIETPRTHLFVIHAALAVAFAASVCPAQQITLLEFELEDQFGETHTTADVRGNALLVVGSDKHGSRYQRYWIDRLRAALGDRDAGEVIEIVELADLRGVPFFVKGSVRKKFPKDRRSWVLMDWKGEFAKAYRFEKRRCNILLFDGSGKLVLHVGVQGADAEMLDEIGAAIDALLRS